jgi:hypothetical protein
MAIKEPTIGMKNGTEGGRHIANNSPVKNALPSNIVIFFPLIFCTKASKNTADKILRIIVLSAGIPKRYIPKAAAGNNVSTTVHMILEVESLEKICGDDDTRKLINLLLYLLFFAFLSAESFFRYLI